MVAYLNTRHLPPGQINSSNKVDGDLSGAAQVGIKVYIHELLAKDAPLMTRASHASNSWGGVPSSTTQGGKMGEGESRER